MPRTDRLTVHARLPAGVSTATFSFERSGVVVGHAVRRSFRQGRVVWHVTDQHAPPFVAELQPTEPPGWLLSRPDGAPFARIVVTSRQPLDLEVLAGDHRLLRVEADGILAGIPDGERIGRLELPGPALDGPDGAVLELPRQASHTLRAALLTLPLCLAPSADTPARTRG
jgi:hypothetical protein